MKSIAYSRAAAKVLARIPAPTARRIMEKVGQLVTEPEALANNIKALSGRPGHHRLRVGDWRVIYTDDGLVIDVIAVGPRGGVYD